MAVARKARGKKKLKFELSLGAIGGIGVIIFCLFLWMFLLGVWAGQSLLFPSYGKPSLTGEVTGKAGQAGAGKVEKIDAK
jgi:hypothetical protein